LLIFVPSVLAPPYEKPWSRALGRVDSAVCGGACCSQCVETQLVERENELHKLTQIRDAILHACHPNALAVIKHNYAVIDAAWHRVSNTPTYIIHIRTI